VLGSTGEGPNEREGKKTVSLANGSPQMTRQLELPLMHEGEARPAQRSEESKETTHASGTPGTSDLMDHVLGRDNLMGALKRVRRNKGSPGVDGMSVKELGPYLRDNWRRIREELLSGTYQPQPVLQKLIPKDGGKTRMLGIPTVLDRFIQQALLQVLQADIDPTFSEHSHGFRPGRSAHDAIRDAQHYVQEGREIVVDVDLAKFFDRVNHDILMNRVARRVSDHRVLRLIRSYLNVGMMANGVVTERREGTPQGGPLSPLLANVLLDEVDKELEENGHAFARYADDLRVFVHTPRAGQRVMNRLRVLFGRLKLVINEEKSAVAPYTERAFLGYSMFPKKVGVVGLCPSKKSKRRFRETVKRMTRRKIGWSIKAVIKWLNPRLRGWANYFRLAAPSSLKELWGWIRRRLRALILSQWKNCRTITRNLRALGASELRIRWTTAYAGRWWYAAGTPANSVLTNKYFAGLGLYQTGS